jgi:hypothetical protein
MSATTGDDLPDHYLTLTQRRARALRRHLDRSEEQKVAYLGELSGGVNARVVAQREYDARRAALGAAGGANGGQQDSALMTEAAKAELDALERHYAKERQRLAHLDDKDGGSQYFMSSRLDNFKHSNTAMPYRFHEPESFEWSARTQHPMYRTQNNELGRRVPVREEMPNKYYGRKGNFSKTFHGGSWRDFGLNTAFTRATVNTEADFF